MSPPSEPATRRVDTSNIEFGDGLEVLLSAVFQAASEGDIIDVATGSRTTSLELPGWARASGNSAVHDWTESSGEGSRFAVRVRKGSAVTVLATEPPEPGGEFPLRLGEQFHTSDLVAGVPGGIPSEAD